MDTINGYQIYFHRRTSKLISSIPTVCDPGLIKEIKKCAKQFDALSNRLGGNNEDAVADSLGQIETSLNYLANIKMVSKLTNSKNHKLAKMMERSAAKILKDAAGDHEPDLIKMYLTDVTDHLKIGLYIKEGKYSRALTAAYDLDSSSADCIPLTVWNVIS